MTARAVDTVCHAKFGGVHQRQVRKYLVHISLLGGHSALYHYYSADQPLYIPNRAVIEPSGVRCLVRTQVAYLRGPRFGQWPAFAQPLIQRQGRARRGGGCPRGTRTDQRGPRPASLPVWRQDPRRCSFRSVRWVLILLMTRRASSLMFSISFIPCAAASVPESNTSTSVV